MIKNIKTVVAYTRVSTEDQAQQGFSLGHQREAIERFCEFHEIKIIRHFQEDGASGKNFDRPEFNKLMGFVKQEYKRIDGLIFTRWDRLSRNTMETLRVLGELKKLNVKLVSTEQAIDDTNPEHKLMLTIYNSIAEIERDKISLRTKEGMRRAMKEGFYVNRPPRGYVTIKIREDKPSLAFSEEADMIRSIFEMYAKGTYTVEDVRYAFKKRGFKRSKQGFINLLSNVTYSGRIWIREDKQRDEPELIVDGLFEPIVEMETFERCQRILHGAQWKYNPDIKRVEDFPLRGHLKCRRCGSNLTASFSGRKGRKSAYYHCLKKCPERFRADFAHQILINFLKSMTIKKEVKEAYILVIREIYAEREKDKLHDIERVNQSIDKVKTKLSSAEDKFIENLIDSETYKKVKGRYIQEVEELENRLTELKTESKVFFENLTQSLSILENLDYYYDKASTEDRKQILAILFPEKLVFENNQYRTHPDNVFISAMVNKIKGFEKGEIEKGDISIALSRLAPQTGLEPVTYPPRRISRSSRL
jgi:site-specific DNA recombinase